MRLRSAWAVPRQEVTPGVPWHVAGSLLGLDIALAHARAAARRHRSRARGAEADVERARHLRGERLAARSVSTCATPTATRSPTRSHAAASGWRTGSRQSRRDRQRAARSTPPGVARWVGRWRTDAGSGSMFSLTELLGARRRPARRFRPWGMGVLSVEGCVCSRLTPPGSWPTLAGRPQLGLAATSGRRQLPDRRTAEGAGPAGADREGRPVGGDAGFHRRSPADRRWRLAGVVARRARNDARTGRRLRCRGDGDRTVDARCAAYADGVNR